MRIAIVGDVHLMEKPPRHRKDNFLTAALDKLEYIASMNDKVIILGDLFHTSNNSSYLFNRVFASLNKFPNKFLAIPGNHDIFHNNMNSLDRTTLGSLVQTGVIDLKTSGFDIDGTHFEVSMVMKDIEKIPVDENNTNILLGHNYFDMEEFAPKETFTREELAKLNYNIVFLGHDHKPHEEEFIENSILIRMGSLTRIDNQDYNESRPIQYYRYDTSTNTYQTLKVPYRASEDVFLEGSFVKQGKKKDMFSFATLSKVLDNFDNQNKVKNSLHKTLVKQGTPRESIDFIQDLYKEENVTYN